MDAIKQYKQYILLACAALGFIFVSFCPTVDVMGKATMSGFKYVFDADGAGFSRFLMLLCILAPLGAGVLSFLKPNELKNVLYCFAAAVVLGIITLLALPEMCGFAWGGWLFLIVSAAGAAVAYLVSQPEK